MKPLRCVKRDNWVLGTSIDVKQGSPTTECHLHWDKEAIARISKQYERTDKASNPGKKKGDEESV